MAIGGSFFAAWSGDASITSITIPDSVTSIGDNFCWGCTGLTSITIPDSVTSIERGFCYGCSGLTSATVGNGVSSIPDQFFFGCSALKCVTVPGHLKMSELLSTGWPGTYLGLTNLVVHTGTTGIVDAAYAGCSALQSITIPQGVETIGQSAFSGCSKLESIFIPDSVTNIGTSAFAGCSLLRILEVPKRFETDLDLSGVPADCEIRYYYNFRLSSDYGSPSPASGTFYYWAPSNLTCSILEPEFTNGVRYTCLGWTGTGSVPASGTETNVTFTIEEDSTLEWNWRKENQISVAASGPGACAFGTQWVEDGTTVTASITPTTHLYTISMSGDTNGVTLAGTTLTIPSDGPREIAVTVTEVKLGLEVATAHGTATPAAGTTEWSWGDAVAASVPSIVEDGRSRYVCTGWTGTGSVPASGTAANVAFTIEEDSSIAWNWRKENQVSVVLSGPGTCAFGTQWIADGGTVTATIVPTVRLYDVSVFDDSGDAGGVSLDGTTLTIRADRPRMVMVQLVERKLALDVATAHGTATPAAGRTSWSWGDTVAVSVEADAPVDGVRYACTGWTGTGSAPASGTGTNVAFTIEEDSTLAWNWRKENRIAVSVSEGGSCAFGTQWVEDGTTATATIVPDTHLYTISMSGDTNGVTLAGATLTIPSDGPREIAVTVTEVKVSLEVATAHGTPTPAAGATEWSWGDTVTASVAADAPVDGVRYVCTGWTGTGSAPASGTGTNVTFTIAEDSSLAWNWRKENRIEVSVYGTATGTFGTQWVADGTTATATILPTVPLYEVSVVGDAEGVTVSGATITIPSDRPRTVGVVVEEVKLNLDVSTERGTCVPAAGRTKWTKGDSVAASVREPEPSAGMRYVCTGWTGTGSAPASGTGTNVTFTIKEDSTLAWNWRKENRIAVSVSEGGSCAFGTRWVEDGTAATATIVPDTHLYAIALAGDTNGVALAGATLTIPSDGPREIAVTVTEVKVALEVATAHGTPTPAAGATEWSWGDTVAASVEADEPVDGVRYVCTGWTGTGSVPTEGTASSVSFAIEEDSVIVWNWEKQNQIVVLAAGEGSCAFGTRWIADGTTAEAVVVPSTPLYRIRLFGDSDGATVEGTVVTIPSDRPRMIGITIEEVDLALTVSTDFGTASPAAGRSDWSWGDMVRASVAMPEPEGGVRQFCTGWTGTGSAPASGTGTNVTFTIEEDSTLAWNWEEQVRVEIAVTSDAPGGSRAYAEWLARTGETSEIGIVRPDRTFAWTLSGDTNGVVVDFEACRLAFPADNPRSVSLDVHVLTVGEAIAGGGEPLAWDEEADWFVVEDSTATDGDGYSLRSGAIGAGQTSMVEATVEGAGTLSFDWRISSNRGHFARFYLDGVPTNSITRSADWATLSFALGNGSHTLRWTYEKGTGATGGEDAAFLDDVRWAPLTLGEALDATNLVWTTEGGAAWAPQIAVSSDGEDAARSGAVVGEETSRLATTVRGAGTLAWKWKADVAGSAGVDVLVDGESLYDAGVYLEGTTDWTDASIAIEGTGEHTVVFEYWNGGTEATISDCAYLDRVSWTPDKPDFVIVEGVKIPIAWLDEAAASIVAANGGDYEAAARATAANGENQVWQCYVAGLDPTNTASRLLATIGFDEEGEPEIGWTPKLSDEGEVRRTYTILGKTSLTSEDWTPVAPGTEANYNFFSVSVEMK